MLQQAFFKGLTAA